MNTPFKSGVIIPPLKDTDFRLGASPIVKETRVADSNWDKYLPNEESQNIPKETNRCTDYSCTSIIETQINWMIAQGKIPKDALTIMQNLHYFDENGKANFSDAFNAAMSGTTETGNQLPNPWDSVRKDGLVGEKDFPNEKYPDLLTREQIPQSIKDKAKLFLTLFTVQYEWVAYGTKLTPAVLSQVLKYAPVQLAVPVCNWQDQYVNSCGLIQPVHAIEGYRASADTGIFDSYPPFRKTLAPDYPIAYGIQGIVTFRPDYNKPHYTFNKNLTYGMRDPDVFQLQAVLKYDLNRINTNGTEIINWNPTGYFGVKTLDAVRKFQAKYNIWTPPTGNVMSLTRKKLNELYGDPIGVWYMDIFKNLFGFIQNIIKGL